MATFDKGDLVRLSATFTDSSNQAVDPTTVTVKYKKPDGTIITKVYGQHAEVVKDATGQYHIDVSIDQSGMWHYRWEGTGAAQAAEEAIVSVEDSVF